MAVTPDLPDLTNDFVAQHRKLQEQLAARNGSGPSESEVAKLRGQLEEAQRESENYRNQLEKAANRQTVLEANNMQLQANIKDHEEQIDRLGADVASREKRIKELEGNSPPPPPADPLGVELQQRVVELQRELRKCTEEHRDAIEQSKRWEDLYFDEKGKHGG